MLCKLLQIFPPGKVKFDMMFLFRIFFINIFQISGLSWVFCFQYLNYFTLELIRVFLNMLLWVCCQLSQPLLMMARVQMAMITIFILALLPTNLTEILQSFRLYHLLLILPYYNQNQIQENLSMNSETGNDKGHKQIIQAFIFFNTPFKKPIKMKKLEQSISTLETSMITQSVKLKLMPLLIQRYYEICNNLEEYKIEQYLVNKFICLLINMMKKTNLKQEQMLIVITWAAVNHLKNCVPQTDHKQAIRTILSLINQVIDRLITIKGSIQKIYPQLSSVLMNYSFNIHSINHIIFRHTLTILCTMLAKIFQNQIYTPAIGPTGKQSQKSFEQNCIIRIQSFLKYLSTKVTSFQLTYQDSVHQFVQKLWPIGVNNIQILNHLAILGTVVGFVPPYQSLQSSIVKMLKSNITAEFVEQIERIGTNILEKKNSLKKVERMAEHITPSFDQCEQILRKFTNVIYLIHNNKSLIVPHLTGQSSSLIQLQASHSFSNYPVGLTAMLQSFDFECDRVLVSKIPFADTSLSNITVLKNIINKLSIESCNVLLQLLVEGISSQQNQYLVDMSLTKFCQYLTKNLLIYWILRKPHFRPKLETSLSLLQIINSCQALRILQPCFQQQEILIGFSLISSYCCYKSLITESNSAHELKQIKKFKIRLALIQMTINNLHETSPIIKLAAQYILISESAPKTVGSMLQNMQTTLVNRNIRNIKFIITLIKLTELTDPQCLDLAERFSQYSGTQQLIKIILPRLTTEMIRKCLLSASGANGKWIHMLLGNTRLLYKKQINQSDEYMEKSQNFYMNDGPNVKITNALGVVLLQLGNKWEYCLKLDSPYKEIALDLIIELLDLDPNMVFFLNRFTDILICLINLIIRSSIKENEAACSQRIKLKVYKLLSLIPDKNFKIYKKELMVKNSTSQQFNSKKQKNKTSQNQQYRQINKFKQQLEIDLKIYKKNYFLNTNDPKANQLYDTTQNIIDKFNMSQE